MATNYEPIDFDNDEPIEIPVKIRGQKYLLCEADGAACTDYRNLQLKCTKLGPEGRPVSADGLASTHPLLVARCLFKIVESEEGTEKRVKMTEAQVRALPGRIMKALYQKAVEISEIDQDQDTAESLQEEQEKLNERIAKLQQGSAGNVPED